MAGSGLPDTKTILSRFHSVLRAKGAPVSEGFVAPDEIERQAPEIDYVSGQCAVEHTRLNLLPKEGRASAAFAGLETRLRQEFDPKLDHQLEISLPYEAVLSEDAARALEEPLRNWIDADRLSSPKASNRAVRVTISGYACRVLWNRDLEPGLRLARTNPPREQNVDEEICRIVSKKLPKLAKYKSKDFVTILLLEAQQGMNVDLEAYLRVLFAKMTESGVDAPNQVWLCVPMNNFLNFDLFCEHCINSRISCGVGLFDDNIKIDELQCCQRGEA